MMDIRAIIADNRSGGAKGLPCFCTANAHVLHSILDHAAETGLPTIIEATCNQVNQAGGYTGMRPQDFTDWIAVLADRAGVAMDQLVLGGDHLGPNPWRREPAPQAMDKARELVRLYVEAGFTKIHLDASMQLGGEGPPSFATIAERAADLCAVAEAHAPAPEKLAYIIGTEVPVPGGETEEPDALDVTSVARFHETVETHRDAFGRRGLEAAWDRIVGVVTQPGVDFGHSSIYRFAPDAARPLSAAIGDVPGLAFEAHSTDYQPTCALRALVENHFALLKVGPELTFRFREAVFALAEIEKQMAVGSPSRLQDVLDRRMEKNDGFWRDYYRGSPQEVRLLRRFSYSDRIRYYWSDPEVATALERLLANLNDSRMPETVVSQYFPGLAFGEIPTVPEELISAHIGRSVRRYFEASGAF